MFFKKDSVWLQWVDGEGVVRDVISKQSGNQYPQVPTGLAENLGLCFPYENTWLGLPVS